MTGFDIKSGIKTAIDRFGFTIIQSRYLDNLLNTSALSERLDVLSLVKDCDLRTAVELVRSSRSQLGQDIVVLSQLNWKKEGYFVEFGATDGITLSNTALLEGIFGWTGILAEPARVWHAALERSGRSAHMEYDCVWKETGKQIEFSESSWAEISTIKSFQGRDSHAKARRSSRNYLVDTVSMNDLLERYNAPDTIDYLSIDTEGSEFEILSSLNFSKYKIKIITCEHNYTKDREKIYDLLVDYGYERRFTELSKFDDWYFLQ